MGGVKDRMVEGRVGVLSCTYRALFGQSIASMDASCFHGGCLVCVSKSVRHG